MSCSDSITELLEFVRRAPTSFHAAHQAAEILGSAGFRRRLETVRWNNADDGPFYVTRHGSTIAAVRPGSSPIWESGCRIAVAHTDAPALKIKPASGALRAGASRATVEVYGGPIVHTWLDRPLSAAGVVVVRGSAGAERRLFDAGDAVAVIPGIAVHLNRDLNKGFEYNTQDHLKPVFSVSEKIEGDRSAVIKRYLAGKLEVDPEDVLDFDLLLYDVNPGAVIGTHQDMISSARLDNLAMSHAILTAFTRVESAEQTNIAVLFDSEEIGSNTFQGAGSRLLRDIIERTARCDGGDIEDAYRAVAGSYLISGDAAHAVHPNFSDKHDEHYQPRINGGPVIKISAGQRYTSTAETSVFFEEMCREHEIPVQRIISRSDVPSGGTIGPVTSTALGIPAVDVGHPIWGMHSIRETGGTADHDSMIAALTAFYRGRYHPRP